MHLQDIINSLPKEPVHGVYQSVTSGCESRFTDANGVRWVGRFDCGVRGENIQDTVTVHPSGRCESGKLGDANRVTRVI